jgi:hypothetical protein
MALSMSEAKVQIKDPAEKSFLTLKNFFETRTAVAKVLVLLESGVEIGIVIGDSIDCALTVRDGSPQLERRAARQPDVVFSIRPETVELLSERTKDEISDIAVNILKEMLAGDVSVRVEANVLDLLRRGYLRVATSGGPAVSAFLARHGLDNVSNIMNTIKKMRP